MKINPLGDSTPKVVGDRSASGSLQAADAGRSAASASDIKPVAPPTSVERIELSETSKSLNQGEQEPFDPVKVAEIRKALSEGRFSIKAEVVADRMIRDSAELIVRIFGADPKTAQ